MTKAAKRKKGKEDLDFVVPEFDEGEYMAKEVEGAKVAVATVILALPVAALLYGLTVAGLAVVAFFLGVALTFSLPRIFRFLEILPWPKMETAKFERRDWLGHGSTFFFSWLAFWILLLNPPFIDLTTPVISLTAFAGGTTISIPPGGAIAEVPRAAGARVVFNVTILENVRVDEATITLEGSPPSNLQPVSGARYSFDHDPGTSGTISGELYARDAGGNVAIFSFNIQFV